MKFLVLICSLGLVACNHYPKIKAPKLSRDALDGTSFYKAVISFNRSGRDSMAISEVLKGNFPSFLRKFTPLNLKTKDSTGNIINAIVFVSPDYLSVGNDHDFFRVPISPMAAQNIADQFGCFLPTRKLVDEIYQAAKVKLEPIPMYAFRDSTPTFYHHHLIIEGQRQGRKGLIAGIKKDVVITGKLTRENRTDRVAIYGWHQLNGKPIQPLYTGHVNWYVDYSHGIRLIYRKIKVNQEWIDYQDVLKHPVLKKLLCDEEYCDFNKYPY